MEIFDYRRKYCLSPNHLRYAYLCIFVTGIWKNVKNRTGEARGGSGSTTIYRTPHGSDLRKVEIILHEDILLQECIMTPL